MHLVLNHSLETYSITLGKYLGPQHVKGEVESHSPCLSRLAQLFSDPNQPFLITPSLEELEAMMLLVATPDVLQILRYVGWIHLGHYTLYEQQNATRVDPREQ